MDQEAVIAAPLPVVLPPQPKEVDHDKMRKEQERGRRAKAENGPTESDDGV